MNYLKWLIYFFSEAFQSIKNNLWTTSITVVTIAISLAVCGLFVGIFVNINKTLNNMGGQIQVVAYLKDGLSNDVVASTRQEIARMPEVDSLEYISKEKAFSLFKNDLKGHNGILEGLNAAPFPASLEIRVKKELLRNPEGIHGFISKLKIFNGIEDVQYGQEWVDRLFAFIRFVEVFALMMGSFLIMATIFIVSNTIRLAIYARREEVEIMSLLGATNVFIRAPFLIKGIIEGFLGASLATGMLYLASLILIIKTPPLFASLVFMPYSIGYISLWLVAIGVIFGMIGSSISLRKFLKN